MIQYFVCVEQVKDLSGNIKYLIVLNEVGDTIKINPDNFAKLANEGHVIVDTNGNVIKSIDKLKRLDEIRHAADYVRLQEEISENLFDSNLNSEYDTGYVWSAESELERVSDVFEHYRYILKKCSSIPANIQMSDLENIDFERGFIAEQSESGPVYGIVNVNNSNIVISMCSESDFERALDILEEFIDEIRDFINKAFEESENHISSVKDESESKMDDYLDTFTNIPEDKSRFDWKITDISTDKFSWSCWYPWIHYIIEIESKLGKGKSLFLISFTPWDGGDEIGLPDPSRIDKMIEEALEYGDEIDIEYDFNKSKHYINGTEYDIGSADQFVIIAYKNGEEVVRIKP